MLKELKKNGRKNLKKHYLLFILVCFLAAFIGSEFVNSTVFTKGIESSENDSNLILKVYSEGVNGAEKHIRDTFDYIETNENDKVFERNKGVLAMAINTLTSGNFYLQITQGVFSAVHSEKIGTIILIIGTLMLIALFFYFVQNVYKVVSRRIFLEGRIYSKVPVQRFVLVIKVRKWVKSATTMFLWASLKTLWMFTIIGGIIKKYSYYLVPYIVAENPDISPTKAIKLSRNMMKGYKWKCFIYEMSFIGWDILSLFTAGTSAVFYSNIYKIATFSEFYAMVRKNAIDNNIELSEYLNDKYLFETATKEVLYERYADVIEEMNANNESELINKKDIRHFLNKYFGISLYGKEFGDAYEKEQVRKMKKEKYEDVLSCKAYPDRLFTITRKKRRNRFETINYLRSYTLSTLFVLFFVLCIIGWGYEVAIHLVRDGVFVNRGTMHGPWLPIYGCGGILILTLLYNFRTNPKKQFFATIILCGIIEYVSSFVLEVFYGHKWWDYSGYFININGRICAEGLLVFGLGGLAISYIVAPMLDNVLKKINKKILLPILTVIVTTFIIDLVYSLKTPNVGAGITTYSYIEEIKENLGT